MRTNQPPILARTDRKNLPELIRHRPPSPLKSENLAVLQSNQEIDMKLQALAEKERSVFELRERRKEIIAALEVAEAELLTLKRDIALYGMREVKEDPPPSEAMTKIAEGGLNAVTAIWHDVISATIGQQATRKA